MSDGAGVVSKAREKVGGGLESLGISDPSTLGILAGGLTSSLTTLGPGAGVIGGLAGKSAGEKIEQAKKDAQTEAERLKVNEDIFRLAESLAGKITGVEPGFDFESLQFSGGDPRSETLSNLVNVFQRRRSEISQQRLEPGSSQTRLSLVE